MEEKEATRFFLSNLTASNTYEQSNIKTIIPVIERFSHALEIIAECKTCTENYRKKIVQSSSAGMAETTERKQNTHHVLQKEIL